MKESYLNQHVACGYGLSIKISTISFCITQCFNENSTWKKDQVHSGLCRKRKYLFITHLLLLLRAERKKYSLGSKTT